MNITPGTKVRFIEDYATVNIKTPNVPKGYETEVIEYVPDAKDGDAIMARVPAPFNRSGETRTCEQYIPVEVVEVLKA